MNYFSFHFNPFLLYLRRILFYQILRLLTRNIGELSKDCLLSFHCIFMMTICRRSKQDGTYILFYFFWSISNSTFRRQCVQIHVIQIAYFKTIFQNKDYIMTKCINSIIAVFTSILCKKYIFIYEGMPSFLFL